jgi:hypothetical protein
MMPTASLITALLLALVPLPANGAGRGGGDSQRVESRQPAWSASDPLPTEDHSEDRINSEEEGEEEYALLEVSHLDLAPTVSSPCDPSPRVTFRHTTLRHRSPRSPPAF